MAIVLSRPWVVGVLGALTLLGLGYALGRFSAPNRVVTHETVKTVEDLQSKARIAQLTAEIETLKRDTHRDTIVITRPDGTRERHTIADTHVEAVKAAETVRVETKIVHDVRTVDREVTKTVERSRPSWRVGPIVVLDPQSLTVSYGAELQRRIVGPLSAGVFGFGRPGAWYLGGGLSLEF